LKKYRKISFYLMAVLLLFTVIVGTGMDMCPDPAFEGRTFEVEGWTLFQFNRSNRAWSREVRLIGLNDPSLVVDGVLALPIRVGRHNIDGISAALAGNFNPGPGVRKIVVPAELRVGGGFGI